MVFALFFLFGIATMSFCMAVSGGAVSHSLCPVTALCVLCRWQIAVFFSRAKTAMVIGVVILFGSVFPYIGVAGSSYSRSSKVCVFA